MVSILLLGFTVVLSWVSLPMSTSEFVNTCKLVSFAHLGCLNNHDQFCVLIIICVVNERNHTEIQIDVKELYVLCF